jgi:hypothetical protein
VEIVLSPDDNRPDRLRRIYERAFREAQELYIASAYLTEWGTGHRANSGCDRIVFVVGTDFGITRKLGLRQALKWLPKRGSILFGAVSGMRLGGFHPKILLWKSKKGSCHCVVGSSNLSRAAFSSNYEANVFASIAASEYRRLTGWIDSVAAQSAAITEDWIEHHYREAKRLPRQTGPASLTPVVTLRLPDGARYGTRVKERRDAQATFGEIAEPIRTAARKCAAGRMSSSDFWREFWGLWSDHESRFQGKGLEMTGKSANWRQACSALLAILNAADRSTGPGLDHVVSREIDTLAKTGNAARGAWLSEMLCHYLPKQYPVLNGPIRDWLAANRWRARRGSTEGQRYTQFAQQLRLALRTRPAGATSLAELDAAIWQWVQNNL